MELVEVTKETQDLFFRCLQDEKEEDPRLTAIRRQWYIKHRDKGYRAKLMILDGKKIVGLCQYIPIELSPLTGKDLIAILCISIHGYDHGVGNQQKQGYGRFMLKAIEEEARAAGAKGIAAWGMDWQVNWMPASFFEHMGYMRTDEEEKVIVFWKPFAPDVNPPKLKRLPSPPSKGADKVNVTVAVNGWCLGCYKFLYAREAVKGLNHIVEYNEVDTPDQAALLHLGKVGGIFLDGEAFQPYQICDKEALRAEIMRLYGLKNKKK